MPLRKNETTDSITITLSTRGNGRTGHISYDSIYLLYSDMFTTHHARLISTSCNPQNNFPFARKTTTIHCTPSLSFPPTTLMGMARWMETNVNLDASSLQLQTQTYRHSLSVHSPPIKFCEASLILQWFHNSINSNTTFKTDVFTSHQPQLNHTLDSALAEKPSTIRRIDSLHFRWFHTAAQATVHAIFTTAK